MNPNELIDKFGGTTAVARLFNIKAPSVHAWRTKGIPDGKHIRLSLLAEQHGVASRQELRPDDWHLLWPELIKSTQSKKATKNDITAPLDKETTP